MRFVICVLVLLLAGGIVLKRSAFKRIPPPKPAEVQIRTDGPLKVSVCQLKSDPGGYNHKLVEVTGFISHGFEDFMLFDPACSEWPGVWLEYGGKNASGTMYCCGVTSARSRPEQLVVEGVPIQLLDDQLFKQFDKLVMRGPDALAHATLVGRFFSGKLQKYPNRSSWEGYGHMGCCSLLAIERVAAVDSQDSPELDYRAEADSPDDRCTSFEYLTDVFPYDLIVKAQEQADTGQQEWAFSDPQRVATQGLARLLKMADSSAVQLTQTRKAQGRFVYEWRPKRTGHSYLVVVSRPYLASFYAKDPKRVAWIMIGAFKMSCGRG